MQCIRSAVKWSVAAGEVQTIQNMHAKWADSFQTVHFMQNRPNVRNFLLWSRATWPTSQPHPKMIFKWRESLFKAQDPHSERSAAPFPGKGRGGGELWKCPVRTDDFTPPGLHSHIIMHKIVFPRSFIPWTGHTVCPSHTLTSFDNSIHYNSPLLWS